jgi:hypothetical protein
MVYDPHKDLFSGWFRQASRIVFDRWVLHIDAYWFRN